MKRQSKNGYLHWVALAEAVGGLSGWLTRSGMKLYESGARKPPLSPPGLVFPIVWTLLFALMGVGAARIADADESGRRSRALRLYGVQLAFNFLWSIIFFGMRSFGLAFFWLLALWGLIVWMIAAFSKVDRLASRLQIPYLLWVSFAAYLNLGVWLLN